MCSTRIVECNLSKCFMDTTRIGSFDIDNKLGEMTYEVFITSNDFRVETMKSYDTYHPANTRIKDIEKYGQLLEEIVKNAGC